MLWGRALFKGIPFKIFLFETSIVNAPIQLF